MSKPLTIPDAPPLTLPRWLPAVAMMAVLLTGCATTMGAGSPSVRSDVWLNSPVRTPADLEGKALLVDFWTFG